MFDHVTIRVTDRGASERFYETVLAELAIDETAGAALAVTGAVGAAAAPTSGFWALLATGVAAVRRGARG